MAQDGGDQERMMPSSGDQHQAQDAVLPSMKEQEQAPLVLLHVQVVEIQEVVRVDKDSRRQRDWDGKRRTGSRPDAGADGR